MAPRERGKGSEQMRIKPGRLTVAAITVLKAGSRTAHTDLYS